MSPDEPSVADVLEFESWPEEQRALAERVLGRWYDRSEFLDRNYPRFGEELGRTPIRDA